MNSLMAVEAKVSINCNSNKFASVLGFSYLRKGKKMTITV